MEFTTFVRKPFKVEAVEVTVENIAEIAELVGSLRQKENGTPYIHVDKRLVPNVFRVYPGYWMTRKDDNIRCYSKKIFQDQFVETTPSIEEWVEWMSQPTEEEPEVEAEASLEEVPQPEPVDD